MTSHPRSKVSNLVKFSVLGNPQSKANSRRLVSRGDGRVMFIKSKSAIGYMEAFKLQCPKLSKLLTGDVCVEISIVYQSGRNDLDESIILDAMQGLIYENDRQVKEKHVYHAGIDRFNPHTDIVVYEIVPVSGSGDDDGGAYVENRKKGE